MRQDLEEHCPREWKELPKTRYCCATYYKQDHLESCTRRASGESVFKRPEFHRPEMRTANSDVGLEMEARKRTPIRTDLGVHWFDGSTFHLISSKDCKCDNCTEGRKLCAVCNP